jgi:electron transfer flavoprotein alpha subunit
LGSIFFILYTFKMISRVGESVIRQARTQLRPRSGPTPVASLSALARLLSSLAVLEQRDGKLNRGSLGAITAAQKLGGSITAFVAGGNIKAVSEEAAKVGGIEKVISVDNAAYDKAWRSLVQANGCGNTDNVA